MTGDSFIDFSRKYLKKKRVISFDLVRGAQEGKQMKVWSHELERVARYFRPDIVIGHSFGGMLCLSTPQLEKYTKGLALLSTAPNMDWERNVEAIKPAHVSSRTRKLLEQFDAKPSQKGLKELWGSWVSYYFSRRDLRRGRQWLKNQHYELDVFLSGVTALVGYSAKWVPSVPTLIAAGAGDRLTPLECFHSPKWRKRNLKLKQVPLAGHFPWIDNPKALAHLLLSLCEAVQKEPL
jgi:pimeloyl-ACP methyl ester carboxylesterase